MKKIIIGSLILASSQAIFADSLLKYQTQETQDIIVNKAKVSLNFYLTILKQSSDTKKSAISEVNSILPGTHWKITDYKEDKTESGAINVKISMSDRLTKSEIYQFRKNLNKYSNNSNSIKIKDVSYSPSLDEIQETKKDLMLKIFKSTREYAKKINKETGGNYQIQEIDFSSRNYPTSVYNSNRMVLLSGVSKNTTIGVSKKYTMSANIVLEDQQPKESISA